ncbi:MAG: hypothetical protein F9K23_09850 [Bacteroidetes bacterium]|nr:MAG: hypothetical protein F9K23_09850 [Bacteroidota bacterium]
MSIVNNIKQGEDLEGLSPFQQEVLTLRDEFEKKLNALPPNFHKKSTKLYVSRMEDVQKSLEARNLDESLMKVTFDGVNLD